MYIRTKDGILEVLDTNYLCGVKVYLTEKGYITEKIVLKQSENLAELCDEFVFNSDVSSYIIDKRHVEQTRAIILKIYKENDETDYVKAMHPKFYGAIWTDKGLIYVVKINEDGVLELI